MKKNSPSPDLPPVSFRDMADWVHSALDTDQLLELIIDTATRMTKARAGSLMLLDEQSRRLFFQAATGKIQEEIRKFELKVGEGIAGHVAATGRPLLVPDLRLDPRWDKRICEHFGFESSSLACVPLMDGETVLGVVQVMDREDGSPLREEDLGTLEVIAGLASMAVVNARRFERIRRENEDLREELGTRHRMIGNSRSLQQAVADALKVAQARTSTLILGESGTGKEVLARLIHNAGPRASKPMVMLNCAALPESLLESELFGHEKGAFTGAVTRKVGRFEMADQGTLFLDEIGEMPPLMQAKLLHILQGGVFYRVGGTEPISVDVRILAATNRDLSAEVAAERFREDLYYRLNVVQIFMPPLRERKEDIPLLVDYFLEIFREAAGRQSLRVSAAALEKMMAYDWPGNVRELRNAVERAVVMGNGREILPADLPIAAVGKECAGVEVGLGLQEAMERFKKEFVRQNLEQAGGNRTKAAGVMKIQRTYLCRLISRYGL